MMKTKNSLSRSWRSWIMVLLVSGAAGPVSAQAPRTGEAIVVAHMGRARASYPVGTVHEGRREARDLFTGASVGELTRITTGSDGHLCMVLSPGALMHVPPNTELVIKRLRHTADGLPRTQDDITRQITLQLNRGGLYIDGGTPTPSMNIRIVTTVGEIRSHGAVFSLLRLDNRRWGIVCEDYEIDVAPEDGVITRFEADESGVMTSEAVTYDPALRHSDQFKFEICRGFFRDLEQFRHPLRGFDRFSVANYLGIARTPFLLGDHHMIADVSPSVRMPEQWREQIESHIRVAGPDGRRWSEDRIWAWWKDIGVIRGVNYIPRNCVNSTEMWMEDTFDTDIIDQELAWAKSLGYTALRITLQQVVWQYDPEGFIERLDTFLGLAANHGLAVVPVLFDDLNRAGRDPDYGSQPEPIPHLHNAHWVPNPGPSRVRDMSQWPALERYVRAVIEAFKRDERIMYWDLYNTAGNDGLWEQTLPLMDQVFNWVRDIDPRQPLAVPAWKEFGSAMAARKLERSDVVTFHSFENADLLDAKIQWLQRYDRPVILSDWLMRQRENTFETILPILATRGVGWFNRGLVKGRTQTWIQEDDYRDQDHPDLWQHDVLEEDGNAYREEEKELIRGFRYHEEADR